MATQYSVTHRTNRMTGLITDIGVNAVIKIFTGAAPTNCGTADTGTLLVTFAGNASQFGTSSAGVLTASAIANATASGSGTAGYYRIYPSSATTTNSVVQGTAGVSGTDMILTSATITSGQVCTFGSFTDTAFGA